MNAPSRIPWPSVIATLAVAAILYAVVAVYANGRVDDIRRQALASQQTRLNETALRLEDYIGVAAQLAQIAVVALGHEHRPVDIERDLQRLLDASDRTLIYGIGVFYVPYSFDPAIGRYGVYINTTDKRRDRMVVVDGRSKYDYAWRPWFIAAQGRNGRLAFTGPYVSDRKLNFIGASESFSTNGKLAGVVLVEALQSELAELLAKNLSPNDLLWVTDADGAILFKATPSIESIDNPAQTHLRLAPWTLHLASQFPEVDRASRAAFLLGIPLTILYWTIVALAISALIRIRRLQLKNLDLQETAYRDALTGLRNRAYVLEQLERELRPEATRRFGVLFVDLDRFAVVNDSLGHSVGDDLLRSIARRLGGLLPEGADVGRVGGDEFVAILPSDDASACESLAAHIIEELDRPFLLGDREIYIGASIGIVFCAPRYVAAGELLRDADTAMYAAKRAGRRRYCVFDENMRENVMARLSMENALRGAIASSEISARYQPIVNLRTGRVASVEALARWTTEAGVIVSPATFVPIAEQCGAIDAIDSIVLRAACRDVGGLFARYDGMTVSVNVSATRLHQGDFAGKILGVLREAKVDPSLVKIELTETAIMERADDGLAVLARLRELGLQIVIDDFGTGHSSLSYAQRLPVAGLKIDRSFITPMVTDRQSLAIVRAIVALAKTLGLYVVAEGVEGQEQAEKLREMGVDYGQGFYFSPALDLAELETFIASREALARELAL